MAAVTKVSLNASGMVNNDPVSASGTLDVDETSGTKSGDITINQSEGRATIMPDSYSVPMPRCFVGARPVDPKVVNPLRLLGTHFVSLRVTDLGSCGRLSQSEHAALAQGKLTSHQVVLGTVEHEPVTKVSGIRETIRVAGPAHLAADGSYTLEVGNGKTYPVTYQHFYRTLTPNAALFHAHQNKVFLLKADVIPTYRGQVVSVRTISTIEYA
jgi:hypothetical protein